MKQASLGVRAVETGFLLLRFALQCLQLADVITSEQYQLYEVRLRFSS